MQELYPGDVVAYEYPEQSEAHRWAERLTLAQVAAPVGGVAACGVWPELMCLLVLQLGTQRTCASPRECS